MITKIFYIPNKGTDAVPCTSANLLANLGMENDYHAVGGDKQLSIITKELFEKLQREDGLCFKRFKPNIVVDTQLQDGKYQVGDSVIIIKKHQKKCFDECNRNDKSNCLMKTFIYDAQVINTGEIKLNDEFIKKA